MSSLYCSILIFCILDLYIAVEYRQERAVIKYYNPKYVSQAQVFTARRGRSHTYTTNGSFTNIHPWNNNVTFKINYQVKQSDYNISWKVGLCDMLKVNWLSDYMKQFSDITLKCPLQKGQHNLYDLVFPPKNFPLPLPKGDTNFDANLIITKTQEIAIDFSIRLRLL